MNVDVDFGGMNKKVNAAIQRQKISVINPSSMTANERRDHERLMEYRNRLDNVKNELNSVNAALSEARKMIAEINSENEILKADLKAVRDEYSNAKTELEDARERLSNSKPWKNKKNEYRQKEQTDAVGDVHHEDNDQI